MAYTIFVRSNEHARTINHFRNARTYYTAIRVNGKAELAAKVSELRAAGEIVSEICTDLGTRIWM